MDYSNWMGSTTAIHGLPLGNICLPASHDSGTCGLTTQLTQDLDADEQKIVTLLQAIAAKIQAIPGVTPYIPDAYAWVYDAVILTIRNLLTANATSVSQQLADGIRCLDLRIYFDSASQQFYTYHTLVGTPLTQILGEIAAFLGSTKAEIVYVTFGHFRGFELNTPTFFAMNAAITQALGEYAYPQLIDPNTEQISNPVFQQTYEEIVSYGTAGSKAVLVNAGYATESPVETFWPTTYSPPDDEGNGGVVAGDYANSSSLAAMISDQQDQYKNRGSLPFALYMLLTPQDTDVTGVVQDSDGASVLDLAAALHPSAAVGGTPTKVAVELITEIEGMGRGRYAGPVGWIDAAGDGEFGIALRSAELHGRTVRLFAGCGIVADSDPEAELAEAQAKFLPVRDALTE